MKSAQIALLLALLIPLTDSAWAQSRTTSSKSTSYKSGFSSQKSNTPSPSRTTPNSYSRPTPSPAYRAPAPAPVRQQSATPPASRNSGFGTFGNRPATPPPSAAAPAAPQPAKPGLFGSFGKPAQNAAPAPQPSQSALSREMSDRAAKDNALRTLDARRAAAQPAPLEPSRRNDEPAFPTASNNGQQPANQYGNNQYNGNQYNNGNQYGGRPVPMGVPQNNNGGVGSAILGFLLGRSTATPHPNAGYPGNASYNGSVSNPTSAAGATTASSGGSFGSTMLRTFAWLAILAAVGYACYFGWKFLRRSSAPSTANYSFERD